MTAFLVAIISTQLTSSKDENFSNLRHYRGKHPHSCQFCLITQNQSSQHSTTVEMGLISKFNYALAFLKPYFR